MKVHIAMLLSCALNVLAASLQHSRLTSHRTDRGTDYVDAPAQQTRLPKYTLRVIKFGAEDGHNATGSAGEQPGGFYPGVPKYPQYPGPQYPPTSEQYPAENAMSSTDFLAVLPRRLNAGDQLIIKGKASDGGSSFTLALADGSNSFDYSQIPFQLHADLLNRNVTLSIIRDGQQTVVSSESHGELSPGATWDFTLQVDADGSSIHVAINGSYHSTVDLMHGLHQIRHLRVSGHIDSVKSLGFEFA